jgi:hypothetical protein
LLLLGHLFPKGKSRLAVESCSSQRFEDEHRSVKECLRLFRRHIDLAVLDGFRSPSQGTVEHTDRGSDEVFSGVKLVAAGLYSRAENSARLLNLCSSQRLEDEHRSVKRMPFSSSI